MPRFDDDGRMFRVTLWNMNYDTAHDVAQDPVDRLLEALGEDELSLGEIMKRMGMSHRGYFLSAFIKPALEKGCVERTIPDKPKSKNQRYRTAR